MATELVPLPFDQSLARPKYEHCAMWAPYDTNWSSNLDLDAFRKRFPQHENTYTKFERLCHVWRFKYNNTIFQIDIPGKGCPAASVILIDVPAEEEKSMRIRQNIIEFVALLQQALAQNDPAATP